ncbi:MAG: hypothetical protein ABF391_01510, partial [Akkermansiaceae bacterium]
KNNLALVNLCSIFESFRLKILGRRTSSKNLFIMNAKSRRLSTILAVALPVLFSSCAVVEVPESNANTGSAAGTPAGYDLGYQKGREDGEGGLSRTPARYGYLYSQADRTDFLRGYEAGYNAGIR